MTEVVIVENQPGSAAEILPGLPGAETPAATLELETPAAIEEVAETVADASVEIARIEADRDITIAAIQADTETMHREAMTEEQRLWHDAEIASIREQLQAERERAETALSVLASPPLETPAEGAILETDLTPISISETQTEASSETPTEPPAESVAPEKVAEAEVVLVRRKTRFL